MVTVTTWLRCRRGHGGEAVGERLAGAELLDRRLAVVGAVGPVAVGVEREGAVAVAAGRAGLRRELDWPCSTSAMVSAPVVVILPATTSTSSVTEPVETPPITATSLVPLMVTVTTWLRCRRGDAVKLSVID